MNPLISEFRSWWIIFGTFPGDDMKENYKRYVCAEPPGTHEQEQAIHVIELSALTEILKKWEMAEDNYQFYHREWESACERYDYAKEELAQLRVQYEERVAELAVYQGPRLTSAGATIKHYQEQLDHALDLLKARDVELAKLKNLGDNLPSYLHDIVRDHNDKLREENKRLHSALGNIANAKNWAYQSLEAIVRYAGAALAEGGEK